MFLRVTTSIVCWSRAQRYKSHTDRKRRHKDLGRCLLPARSMPSNFCAPVSGKKWRPEAGWLCCVAGARKPVVWISAYGCGRVSIVRESRRQVRAGRLVSRPVRAAATAAAAARRSVPGSRTARPRSSPLRTNACYLERNETRVEISSQLSLQLLEKNRIFSTKWSVTHKFWAWESWQTQEGASANVWKFESFELHDTALINPWKK